MDSQEKEYTQTKVSQTSVWETGARILSIFSNPFLIPLLSFVMLFNFTYLEIMPLPYQIFVLGIVCSFTIIVPWLFIYIYKRMNHWHLEELSKRKKRFIPYILTLLSYLTCLLTMYKLHLPRYFSSIIIAVFICILICFLLNLRWRISIHMAGCGLLIGGLLSYGLLFLFNPIWWLCGFILLFGLPGTIRIMYYQHSLLEVIVGFIVGMFCGIIGILFI